MICVTYRFFTVFLWSVYWFLTVQGIDFDLLLHVIMLAYIYKSQIFLHVYS